MFAIVGSRVVLAPRSLVVSIPSMVWVIGLVLIVVNGVLTALRSERGVTLEADGITWHRAELFIPWSQVTALELGTGQTGKQSYDAGLREDRGLADWLADHGLTSTRRRGEQHLIVRTLDPAEALSGQRGLTKLLIQANIQRFGGPIAVKDHLLAVPSDAVIAAADRLRHAPVGPADPTQQARRARALSLANLWAFAGFAGLVAGLATIVLRNLT
jgi:hypothetical protein